MPRYLCPNCKGVFCGWSVKYKHEGRCPECGSELQEVNSNNQTDKQKFRRGLIDKVLKTRKNLRSGNL